ncbi:MAG: P13 family porin [Spirochaetaceae bacterium]|jgi:hypothetical protein|nr:P13 family porin [Spirochaetaceae bacterium]
MNTIVKKIFIAVILLSLTVTGFTDENDFIEMHSLIKDGLNKNYELINEKAQLLNLYEKLFLFDIHKKDIGIPLAANILAGFGLGSYIQGDIVSGTIQLSGHILGLAAMVASVYSTVYAYPVNIYSSYYLSNAGAMIFCASRLYGCVSPFIYMNTYNKKLKAALQYYSISYNVFPSIDEEGGGKITAMLSIKL